MNINISIKNRLRISSIYMVAIVLAIGMFLFFGSGTIYLKLKGVPLDSEKTHPYYFSKMIAYTRENYLRPWRKNPDIDEMLEQAAMWNTRFQKDGFALAIYKKGELLTAKDTIVDHHSVANLLLSKDEGHFMILDSLGVFTTIVGEYTVAIAYDRISPGIFYYDKNRETLMLLSITGALLVTLCFVNLFLMRFVARPINLAMAALMEGIRHIRDGDLDYVVAYWGQDEFAKICDNFNEMAWRLNDSTQRIQREKETRKELIAGISHDLHTPLASIKAYVEGLEKGIANTPEKQKHYLHTLGRKAAIMEKIIDRLFTVSKLDLESFPIRLVRAELGEELTRIVDEVREEYRESGLLIEIADDLPSASVDIDKNLLQSIFVNIFENSLKYRDKKCVRIGVALRRRGGEAEITLEDDGPGVEEDELERIFDVFYRCDKSRSNAEKGSGLGLAVSAKIISRFGGTIRAENVPAGGLAIRITLPVKEEDTCPQKC